METCLFTEGMICNNWWQTVTSLHSNHLQALAALISWQSMQHMTISYQLAKLFPLSEGKALTYGKLASHREHVLRKGNCSTPAFSSSPRLKPFLQGPLKPQRIFLFFFLATSKHVLRHLVVALVILRGKRTHAHIYKKLSPSPQVNILLRPYHSSPIGHRETMHA